MRTTTYCYPWDLARLGVARTLNQIVDEGFDAIDLAATYHPIDALSPRGGGAHLFSDPRGAVYFPVRPARYGRIKPLVHAVDAVTAAWPTAADHAARIGLDLNAWTITLFQPWIRDLYPDAARVVSGGEANGSGICAANPDVREYMGALCADVAEQFGVALFRLEAVLPYGFDFDWLRPRVTVPVPSFAKTLSNLCFCGACNARGEAAGLDVVRIRKRVNVAIGAAMTLGDDNPALTASLAADADLLAFAESHVRASIELVRHIGEAIGGKQRLATNVGNPYRSLLGADRDDALVGEFLGVIGQIDVSPTDPGENIRVAALNARSATPYEMSTLCIVTRQPEPTVASAAQRVSSRGGPVKDIAAEADLGVREFTLYNYGLVTDAEVRIFHEAVARLAPAGV